MNPSSVDIKDMIEASDSGLILSFGTDLFIGSEPDKPDKCVTIYDMSGGTPARNFTLLNPSIQVRVRGDEFGYLAAYALAESIRDFLHVKTLETINGAIYVGIVAQGDIGLLKYDEQRRPIFTMNFEIWRTE